MTKRKGIKGLYKKQKRQDWDLKAYLINQVLYIVQLPNEEGDMHIIYVALGASGIPCDPNLVSSAFVQSLYYIYLFCM